MALDIDTYLAELPGDEPYGPFLEIDERLSRGKAVIGGAQKWAEFKRFPGRFPDESMRPAEIARPEVDSAIKGLLDMLGNSRDLRVVAWLAQGFVLRGRLDDLHAVLKLAVALIKGGWEYVNPRFPESAYDTAAERVDPLRPLNDGEKLWWLVREIKIAEHNRLGVFTMGDLAPKAKPGENTPPSPDGMDAALIELGRDSLRETLGHLDGIIAAFTALETEIAAALRASGGEAEEVPPPEFDEVRAELKLMSAALRLRVGPDEEEVEDVPEEEAAAGGGAPARGAAVSAPGTISSREDVLRVLQSLMDYYAKNEPGSPVPLLLTRARNLVGKDFLELLNDLAPESVDGVSRLAGRVL